MWCLVPGERSSPRNLDRMLREYRDEIAAQIETLRARAEDAGAPVDGLDPLLPYEDDDDLASVEVVFRAVARREYLALINRLDELAKSSADESEKLLVNDELERSFVARAVAEVRGLAGDAGPVVVEAAGDLPLDDESLEVLHAAGVLPQLFTAAKRFQLLTGKKKRLCGLSPPTTGSTSASASSVPHGSGHSEDAMEEPPSRSGRGPSTRTTPAPADTC